MSSTPPIPLDDIDAWVFDLDGVLTDTARLHAQAWADVFDRYFAGSAAAGDGRMAPLGDVEYRRLVGATLPATGVRPVLSARHASLPDGEPDDGPDVPSAWGLVNAQDDRYRALVAQQGARPYPSSVSLLRRLREAGADVAVVSASRHCAELLVAAGLTDLVDARVDGWVARAMGLPGKPDPALFLEAAHRLGVEPSQAVVVDAASAGVEAGRTGGFGFVIGVDRAGGAGGAGGQLAGHGATVVVGDLDELVLAGEGPARSPWRLTYRDPSPAEEGLVETLCTLANGNVGTRGAKSWAHDDGTSYPGTYIAGLYNRLTDQVDGQAVENESLVNAPNWLTFSLRTADEPWLGADPAEARRRVVSHLVRLDLRRGTLLQRCTVVDGAGRTTVVVERRVVSMADPRLLAQELSVMPIDWSGGLELYAGVQGDVVADETQEERLLAHCHLELVDRGVDGTADPWLEVRTVQSDVTVALAARCRLRGPWVDEPTAARGDTVGVPGAAGAAGVVWRCEVAQGARVTLEKVVALFTSRDRAISEPCMAAREAASAAPSFAALVATHEGEWDRLWVQTSGTVRQSSSASGPVLNLQLFHLLQVASPNVVDLDTGLGARGLHGEGYRGHVFWDSLFVYAVLALRFPAVAKAVLDYRSRRLPAARRLARADGHAGAMFPWQSGSDGRDETPTILYNPRSGHWMPDRSRFQRHVGLAIAFSAWQHWQVTGDLDFLAGQGTELIVEVSRFFAGLVEEDHGDGRCHIAGVVGPDEFHDGYPWSDDPGVTDNAYTNILTSWLLQRAAELVGVLASGGRTGMLERLGVEQAEVDQWQWVASHLAVPFHDGVLSQFAGYEKLEPLDIEAYRQRYGNIGRLDLILEAEGDAVRRYQVCKQADVLMLFYLFSAEELRAVMEGMGYSLDAETIRRTVAYYSQRATHGSSLSAVVHAWVLARADRQASWRYFLDAMALDVADTQGGTTREGIHLGAMGGTVDLLQRCYTGLEVRDGALWLNPLLPAELEQLSTRLLFRGVPLTLAVDHHRLRVAAQPCLAPSVSLVLCGEAATLDPGRTLEVPLKG